MVSFRQEIFALATPGRTWLNLKLEWSVLIVEPWRLSIAAVIERLELLWEIVAGLFHRCKRAGSATTALSFVIGIEHLSRLATQRPSLAFLDWGSWGVIAYNAGCSLLSELRSWFAMLNPSHFGCVFSFWTLLKFLHSYFSVYLLQACNFS